MAIEMLPNWLPAGWDMEVKVRKNGQKDKYYTDPVTGYVFRSKRDVFRYLDSGEVGKYAFKPKNGGINDVESMAEDISPPTASKRWKREGCAMGQSSNLNDTVKDGQILEESVVEKGIHFSKHALHQCGECADPSGLAPLEAEGSNKREGKRLHAENRLVSVPPAAGVPHKKQPLKNGVEMRGNIKSQLGSSKYKDKKGLNFPRRASKRLAGLDAEPAPDLATSDRTRQVAAVQSALLEANLAMDTAGSWAQLVSERLDQLESEPKANPAPHASRATQVPSEGEKPLKKGGHPLGIEEQSDQCEKLLGNQVGPGKLKTEEEADKKPESPLILPFGDSWPDPCLEFAFKTLTGVISIEDNLVIQDYFKQQMSSVQTLNTSVLALPGLGKDSFCQTGDLFQFDLQEKPTLPPQLQEKPSPGNESTFSRAKFQ